MEKVTNEQNKKVVIVQKTLPHYRESFFISLHESLAEFNIDLQLIYGADSNNSNRQLDKFKWVQSINNKVIKIGKKEIYWQPCLSQLRGKDLIIVEQANKLVINYILLLKSWLLGNKMAFWGHGQNFQAHKKNSIFERVKKVLSTKVHWWFAYNNLSADIVESLGFPKSNITSVKNAIDTSSLRQSYTTLPSDKAAELKEKYGLKGNNVCLYCGSLYKEKRIDFLLEACLLIKNEITDFELLIIGTGPDKEIVDKYTLKYNWIKYIGPVFNEDKAPFFKISKYQLMPGAVGLGILDSFALETPLVTTNLSNHGPEIDYLENGVNGVILNDKGDKKLFAKEVILLLKDYKRLKNLIDGCRQSSMQYSLETMVNNYAIGVKNALEE